MFGSQSFTLPSPNSDWESFLMHHYSYSLTNCTETVRSFVLLFHLMKSIKPMKLRTTQLVVLRSSSSDCNASVVYIICTILLSHIHITQSITKKRSVALFLFELRAAECNPADTQVRECFAFLQWRIKAFID